MSKEIDIRDLIDRDVLERIMKNWSLATGMACIAMDAKGEYISGEIGFTDFCMKGTRGTEEGMRRCVKCDQTGHDVYPCHAGLYDFSKEIVVDGILLGKIIGGQALPEEPDEAKFRKIAEEIGTDPDQYIEDLRKIKINTKESILAGANLLGDVINQLVASEYYKKKDEERNSGISDGVKETVEYINNITSYTKDLDKLEKNQKILALNASIEAARAGEAGKGFAIVANKVGSLAADFGTCNKNIKSELTKLTDAVSDITGR